jgi:hypothetical protein
LPAVSSHQFYTEKNTSSRVNNPIFPASRAIPCPRRAADGGPYRRLRFGSRDHCRRPAA